ncbi:hypothetical protein C4F49_16580 [Sphingobacterium sp. KB22]|uniref:Uncharacterized protein n=1 Tax=Sphingobacterium hungaricum TaxID=2082723 RepID=A0A928V049_9SPHI|nr:hypothetical protein [Sphingobacterium hungaricum]
MEILPFSCIFSIYFIFCYTLVHQDTFQNQISDSLSEKCIFLFHFVRIKIKKKKIVAIKIKSTIFVEYSELHEQYQPSEVAPRW